MITKTIPENISATLRGAKNRNMLNIPVNEGRNNAFNYYAASAWNKFQHWQNSETGKKLACQQKNSWSEECRLRIGLNLKCCCSGNYCKNTALNRPMTDKEIMLKQRKEKERALKVFKKMVKIWILAEVPQD